MKLLLQTSIIGLMLLIHQLGWAQAPADIRFLPAPSLRVNVDLSTQVLQHKQGQYQFSWLEQDIRNHKVLLLGESHWMHEVQQLLIQLVLYANIKDHFPLLVLELPFSATAFVNAYLDADSVTASQYIPAVKPFFRAKESMQWLQTLKRWNSTHPTKKITIACSDIEQGLGYSLKNVFNPFFKAMGEDRLLPMVMKANTITPEILAFMDSVMRAAPVNISVANAPFLTRQYVFNVWGNFKATYEAGRAMDQSGYAAYAKHRADRIYHHLTNDAYFGKDIKAGKSILWGGANHAKVYQPVPIEDTLRMEGWRLAHEFEPTKNKVYSIKAVNLAYAVPARTYTSDAYQQATNGSVQLVDLYKKDVPAYQVNKYRTIDTLTNFSGAFVLKSQANANLPVYINQATLQQATVKQPLLKQDAVWQEFSTHDVVIVVPNATLFDYDN